MAKGKCTVMDLGVKPGWVFTDRWRVGRGWWIVGIGWGCEIAPNVHVWVSVFVFMCVFGSVSSNTMCVSVGRLPLKRLGFPCGGKRDFRKRKKDTQNALSDLPPKRQIYVFTWHCVRHVFLSSFLICETFASENICSNCIRKFVKLNVTLSRCWKWNHVFKVPECYYLFVTLFESHSDQQINNEHFSKWMLSHMMT